MLRTATSLGLRPSRLGLPLLLGALCAPALLLACKGAVAPSESAYGDVVSLVVTAEETELSTRQGEPATTRLTATATFEDGTVAPIDLVSWSLSNLSVGTIDEEGLFTAADRNGGITDVVATHRGIEGRATLRVTYREDLLEEGVDTAVVAAFEAATPTAGDLPALLYPADQVRVPRNLEGLGFLWAAPESHNVFRLRLRSDITEVSVYSALDTWYASSDLWAQIAASNRGGEVSVSVESGTYSGGALTDVRVGPAITLSVNRLDARGSVLYWAASVAGVMRIPFGTTQADPFWTRDDVGGECIGCHTVNNPTDRMVMTHNGINGTFSVVDVSDPLAPVQVVPPNGEQRVTFKTISPDGQYMIGTSDTSVVLYDLATGLPVKDLGLVGRYTQPDWSPDGEQVVFVKILGNFRSEFDFELSDLVVFDWDGAALSNERVLISSEDGYTYYYPAWSPDGEWLAYNRTIGSGYASPTAELMLASRDGLRVVRLDTANGEDNNQNSYPRWGPLPDDEVLWLAFSSKRSYPIDGLGQPQIWVSAIDPSKAEAGADPSSAPFWLPGQDTGSDNHLPFWWKR